MAYGRSAVLVELDDNDEAVALHSWLTAGAPGTAVPDGVIEVMPGLRTVLIRVNAHVIDHSRLSRWLADAWAEHDPQQDQADRGGGEEVLVRVDYAGPDLDEVAQRTHLSVEDVIAAHVGRRYRVVLIGMAPGFYFLSGGDPRLQVPRRSSPRTNVLKGSVGLAGQLTGIYPRPGPGGWQLIGRAVDDLWHPTRLPAALLSLGTSVRFAAA